MPIHDWSRVPSGVFHDFHQAWTVELTRTLNKGAFPIHCFSMVAGIDKATNSNSAVQVQMTTANEPEIYSRHANRIIIRKNLENEVAVIQLVSPGHKINRDAASAFVDRTCDLLERGIHVLVIDLFPPSAHDPDGIHAAIWRHFCDQPIDLSHDKPLMAAAYMAGPVKTAYVQPFAVGDELPSMPVFVTAEQSVSVPLEATYQAAWDDCPEPVRTLFAI